MEIIGLQDAIKVREEKNTFSIYEITTTPGLAERIDYIIRHSHIIDKITYSGFSNQYLACWDCYNQDTKLDFDLYDFSTVKVQWKHACDPGLANLKYLESASCD